ncbi:2OG-Fe(II) oxygenase [Sphingosinicella sp. LHD-64]|uniref:2OG-Fe(II) oxygenase n=1 Tax=Sphingosinicella sp. LHD-64 TaxID=3072139 RepID=UPI00280E748A|nr:2OG-Fe(II) oxygenase [Sphingosinicella sp. LHD-64]MDQ8754920.1 2OG-Fe(II) oxygenase [Sphingosinicella sp. LHD-64]
MNARSTPPALGEPAPWFRAAALEGSSNFVFDTVAGRPILMLFFGSAAVPACRVALDKMMARRDLFDDRRAAFFGVTVDPADAAQGRIRAQVPGIRFFLDYDRAISGAYGALGEGGTYRGHWLLLDRAMRVTGAYALRDTDAALAAFNSLVERQSATGLAPVLIIEDLLEPALCQRLIALYEADGGEDSGFMRDIEGKTRLVLDPAHKVRRDYVVNDPRLIRELQLRLRQRLAPMIWRAFSFEVTRVERLIVACYEAESGGHFRAHRDNTTKGTAHRRFAVTINLNADDYEGGDLRFPEFGPRLYRAPTGGAVVFSCSLLHEATPVTRGRRFAFLPFLYDEAAALLRERNASFLEGDLANYRASDSNRTNYGSREDVSSIS